LGYFLFENKPSGNPAHDRPETGVYEGLSPPRFHYFKDVSFFQPRSLQRQEILF
jgi:hypothetical protein